MALSKSDLKSRIVSEFENLGATANGEHSWVNKMAEAIANAVIDEIQANGKASVTSGSSTGEWPIQ
jgi:glycyl-tRNA synthetase beta subunit